MKEQFILDGKGTQDTECKLAFSALIQNLESMRADKAFPLLRVSQQARNFTLVFILDLPYSLSSSTEFPELLLS